MNSKSMTLSSQATKLFKESGSKRQVYGSKRLGKQTTGIEAIARQYTTAEPSDWPLLRVRWNVIVLDEVHGVFNLKKATWQAAIALHRQFTMYLTATRLMNRYADIGGLFYLLRFWALVRQRVLSSGKPF